MSTTVGNDSGWRKWPGRILRCTECSLLKLYQGRVLGWLVVGILLSSFTFFMLIQRSYPYRDMMELWTGTVTAGAENVEYQAAMPKLYTVLLSIHWALISSGVATVTAFTAILIGCCSKTMSDQTARETNTTTQCSYGGKQVYVVLLLVVIVATSQVFELISITGIALNSLSDRVDNEITSLLQDAAEVNINGMNHIENKFICCGVRAATGGVSPDFICSQHTDEVPDCTTAVLDSLLNPVIRLILFLFPIIKLIQFTYIITSCCKRQGSRTENRNVNAVHTLIEMDNMGET